MEQALATRTGGTMARRDELTIEDMVAQVQKIQQVMDKVMKKDEHYGVIPGTGSKPSLLKAGAEKLCLLFRLAPTYTIRSSEDGRHLTIESTCTLTHIPTGEVWGSGMGSCSTKESKYAYRKGARLCPNCGKDAIIKGKAEYGGGWVCFNKKGGCGSKWKDGAQEIEGQNTDRVANEDVADQYNTVLKMSNKRALVAGVLNVTAASDIFTQDLEDIPQQERQAPVVVEATEISREPGTGPAAPRADSEDEARRLFATPEEEERNILVAKAIALAKKMKLSALERNAFKQEYLGGAEPADADLSALAAMVTEMERRAA